MAPKVARNKSVPTKLKRSSVAQPPALKQPPEVAIQFLENLGPHADEQDMVQMVAILSGSESHPDLLRACYAAASRLCQDDAGFHKLLQCGYIEALQQLVVTGTHGAEAGTRGSSVHTADNSLEGAVYQLNLAVVRWLEHVDHVDFPEIPNVLYVARWLGCEYEAVALATLATMERFVLHRQENVVTLLEGGALKVLHRMIAMLRAPELVQEALCLLYRMTDIPGDIAAPHIVAAAGVADTVVEALEMAPLNMRLQLAGFRLLSLWSQLKIEMAADPRPRLAQTLRDLESSGFPHAAAWMSVIADGALH